MAAWGISVEEAMAAYTVMSGGDPRELAIATARRAYIEGRIEVEELDARLHAILLPSPQAVALSSGMISINEARTL